MSSNFTKKTVSSLLCECHSPVEVVIDSRSLLNECHPDYHEPQSVTSTCAEPPLTRSAFSSYCENGMHESAGCGAILHSQHVFPLGEQSAEPVGSSSHGEKPQYENLHEGSGIDKLRGWTDADLSLQDFQFESKPMSLPTLPNYEQETPAYSTGASTSLRPPTAMEFRSMNNLEQATDTIQKGSSRSRNVPYAQSRRSRSKRSEDVRNSSSPPGTQMIQCQWDGCGKNMPVDAVWGHIFTSGCHLFDVKATDEVTCRWLGCTLDRGIRCKSLRHHLGTHSDLRTIYPCPKPGCESTFTRTDALARHVKQEFWCKGCAQYFPCFELRTHNCMWRVELK